jgi:chromate reductase, NAD(P)H dehydrogenase (quinone)
VKVVAISGSLRGESSNGGLLRAVQRTAPSGLEVFLYDGLAALPHFNPDNDLEGAPADPAVADLRAMLASADGVIISSPEYAHGVPGSLKNALDWLVSSGELIDKPVLLLNAALAGGHHAQESLRETVTMLSANVLDASLMKPFLKSKLTREGAISDPESATALGSSLESLAAAIRTRTQV